MDHKNPYEVETIAREDAAEAPRVSIEHLKRLVQLLDASDVSEIEVKRPMEGMQLVLRKAKAQTGSEATAYAVVSSDESDSIQPEKAAAEPRHTINAPLVGIFHSWGKPKGNPLVAVSDRVKPGQLVGTIQSLNVINEVESTIAGSVTEILVQDGQAVEYGQQLFVIDSSEEA
ncbi:acetyl-CoA carboxylase biotin carboxyl carrier protein [Dictyobacter formicarum]|uniref:Acetyl-CoA carboxylase biotin carboxyl carrier protein subunit n=1 Tax=Dictyobacter formicarum TaxID=2778368 RepID=A0ABQ3VG33_9CHLR|nr:biotin/lipoyl-containing protein [Dictyobacter formicarum]GHO84333.1 acetyl-CoA carboxylase biotin carboxyl carrier protein subunit [Dictyobacter formicarum]